MFQYPLLQGTANRVMKDAYSLVLTQSTAKVLFGNENAIGTTVRFDNKDDAEEYEYSSANGQYLQLQDLNEYNKVFV